jgi:hypothetical protein
MKIVDEHTNIEEIENLINQGYVENLIEAAHNELKLIRIAKSIKLWELEELKTPSTELLEQLKKDASFHANNANYINNERFEATPKPARPSTANFMDAQAKRPIPVPISKPQQK